MNDTIYQGIEENPRFKELVRKRGRFAWLLSLITLALYVGFILLIAFDPQWLGTPIAAGSTITRRIPVGVRADRDLFRLDRDLRISRQRRVRSPHRRNFA